MNKAKEEITSWTKVKDRLPDETGLYQVYNNWGTAVSLFCAKDKEFIFDEFTHWAPLLDPPVEK